MNRAAEAFSGRLSQALSKASIRAADRHPPRLNTERLRMHQLPSSKAKTAKAVAASRMKFTGTESGG
jgi:hypothetical protein